ncbi:DUF2652 domain-containing protein [Winogradskyella sp. MIT101101]|uniref:DUF2652 domain-containing protein n=1 Tax=Winogradskyella sp. MIT101101 TaxID=3098297 RepID=UPI00399A1AE7
MSETDYELNSKVVPSLLNEIIYSNEIGLKVSEIEGDAVLFFKRGELPPLKDLIAQCEFFYTQFYRQLRALHDDFKDVKDGKKISQTLGLKIVLHFAKGVDSVQIGKHIKLVGEDVIVAHRLLKNKIDCEEYILLSNELLKQYTFNEADTNTYLDQLKKGKDYYEHIGEIEYSYIDFKPLI